MSGRNVGYSETAEGFTHTVGYKYNSDNNLIELTEDINGAERTTTYEYDDDNRTTEITTNGTTVEYTYDGFGRVTQQVTKVGETVILTEYFTYTAPTATTTSGQVATYRTVGGSYDITYSYTYDANGNIRTVSDGTNTTTYSYDSANQLIREDNQAAGKSYIWIYDDAGNIKHTEEFAYTDPGTQLTRTKDADTHTYGSQIWGDMLTAYNGTAIQYDGSGNPVVHGSTRYTWEHGRQLASMLKDGVTWNYTYNTAGLRTGRYVQNGTAYKYVYNGGQLMQMTKDNQVVSFSYDAGGTPLTMKVYTETEENGIAVTKCDTYYYVTNIQGDVMALLNASGTTVVSYAYTAYGIVTATGDADVIALNPLTYRGYVFDAETGLYYLQSRYYDPAIGRFVNADGVVAGAGGELLGCNMFAYCFNNPVNMVDLNGNWPSWGQVLKAVATVAVAAVVVTAVVASAGSVGLAAGVIAAELGASGALVGAAVTAGTVGTYAVATGIGACALSNAGEILTGNNVIRDELMGGNQDAYNELQSTLAIAGYATTYCGSTIPSPNPSTNSNNVNYNFNGTKSVTYATKRGWNDAMISNAIRNGKQGSSVNLANGENCTAYLYPGTTNQYVVIENQSGAIVQLSNFNDPNWYVDKNIEWYP